MASIGILRWSISASCAMPFQFCEFWNTVNCWCPSGRCPVRISGRMRCLLPAQFLLIPCDFPSCLPLRLRVSGAPVFNVKFNHRRELSPMCRDCVQITLSQPSAPFFFVLLIYFCEFCNTVLWFNRPYSSRKIQPHFCIFPENIINLLVEMGGMVFFSS